MQRHICDHCGKPIFFDRCAVGLGRAYDPPNEQPHRLTIRRTSDLWQDLCEWCGAEAEALLRAWAGGRTVSSATPDGRLVFNITGPTAAEIRGAEVARFMEAHHASIPPAAAG